MAVALDIVKGALRYINSYQSGETIAQADAQDVLDTLNDLLDSWSTDKVYVFGSQESILTWQVGKTQYKIGNPTCTQLGLPTFTGTLTGGSNVVTGVTNIPSGLVAGQAVVDFGSGSILTDSANVLPANTYVTAIGANTLTLSAAAMITPSSNPVTLTYTLPGDFPIPRPLRITGGYTRINQLDFWLDVYATQDQYNSILYKAQPGPWPVVAWYNNVMPYGLLNVYQAPGQNAQLHLFTDTILSGLTLEQTVEVPQGYVRALKWLLAREIAPQYGYAFTPQQNKIAGEALSMIKALNAQPAPRGRYDRALVRGNRPDGGWVTHGGFGR